MSFNREGDAAGSQYTLAPLGLAATLTGMVALLCGCGLAQGAGAGQSRSEHRRGAQHPAGPYAGAGARTHQPAFPVRVTDALGHVVVVSSRPRRIVSLGPSVTETLFAIGAGPRVVADSSYDDYPPAAVRLPKIGDFMNPSAEKVLAFHPDLVVAVRGNNLAALQAMERVHLTVFAVDPRTVADVASTARVLGRLTGSPGGDAAAAAIERRVHEVQAAVRRTGKRPPRCLIEVWNNPVTVAGRATFPSDVLRLAGGVNIAPAGGPAYPQLSNEALVALQPDVLFLAETGVTPDSVQHRPGAAAVPAIRRGRVYAVDPSLLTRPAPRIVLALAQVAHDLYPEAVR